MPCRCDYLEPSEREEESKLVCELLIYLSKMWGESYIPEHILKGAENIYGSTATLDKDTMGLWDWCQYIESNPAEHHLMYDGRSKNARKLADWWEKHKEEDKEREMKELEFSREELLELEEKANRLGFTLIKKKESDE